MAWSTSICARFIGTSHKERQSPERRAPIKKMMTRKRQHIKNSKYLTTGPNSTPRKMMLMFPARNMKFVGAREQFKTIK